MISRVLQSTLKILLTTIDLMPDDKTLQQRAESWASDALGPDHAHPQRAPPSSLKTPVNWRRPPEWDEATMLAMVSHEFERGPTRGLRHVSVTRWWSTKRGRRQVWHRPSTRSRGAIG